MHKFAKMVASANNSIREFVSTFGKITSVGAGGRKVNVSNDFGGEIRDAMMVTPYGIASCGIDGLFIQLCDNGDNDNNTAIGVFDPEKPAVQSGEIIIYNRHGDQIKLSAAGGIQIKGSVTFNGDVKINGNFTTSGGTVRLN